MQFLAWRKTLTLVFEAGNSNRDTMETKQSHQKILCQGRWTLPEAELLENITHMFGFDL